MTHSYYTTLNIENNATANEIKQAYRKLAREHHPDKGGDENQFKKVQEAYQCLIDNDKRNEYDDKLERKHMPANGMGFFGHGHMPANVMEFFRSHVEETLWGTLGRSVPQKVPTTEVCLSITLIDVCCGGEKKVDFERNIFVDALGNKVKLPQLATHICSNCNGSGNEIRIMNNKFFIQQSIAPCSECLGEGYVLINGCQLIKRKCRFQHNIPIGTLNGEQFIYEHEGDIIFNKKTRQFYQGHIVITVNYNVVDTNKILYDIYEFPNITISKVDFGDIHYTYEASVFEFITGTEFNLPLSNNRFMLIKLDTLHQSKTINEFGLPQIVNKTTGAYELRNIVISFKMQPFNKKINISDSNRIILQRIFSDQYPLINEQDAIVVDYKLIRE